jgi:hypothetical protein
VVGAIEGISPPTTLELDASGAKNSHIHFLILCFLHQFLKK